VHGAPVYKPHSVVKHRHRKPWRQPFTIRCQSRPSRPTGLTRHAQGLCGRDESDSHHEPQSWRTSPPLHG